MNSEELSCDVIIIGGGSAGISASIWCSDLGLSSILFEGSAEIGGQLLKINAPISNYPGVAAANGNEMRNKFETSLRAAFLNILCNEKVVSIEPESLTVITEIGTRHTSRFIVIATGVRRRTLGVKGEIEFLGRGVLASGVGSKDLLHGKSVVIVGGGDAALENATILSKVAETVTLIHRRDKFSARTEFVDQLSAISNLKILKSAKVVSINGTDAVESITFVELETNLESTIPSDAVLIRVGVVPNTDFLANAVETDENGYIVVDRSCQTNRPGVFAIGDISNKTAPTIAGAVGDAATAIKTAYSLLAAS